MAQGFTAEQVLNAFKY